MASLDLVTHEAIKGNVVFHHLIKIIYYIGRLLPIDLMKAIRYINIHVHA